MADEKLSERLLRVAWLSVLLGLGMEVILLIAGAGFGKIPALKAIIADLVQKISWSSLVCVGVAVGTAAGKMRSQAMGLAGLIAAPVAFYVAKVLHKSASQALDIAVSASAGGPSPLFLATLKGLEYAVLGVVVGQIGKKNASAGIRHHILAGLVVGLVFGGTIVYLVATMAAKPLPLAGIISRSVNEIIFPVGCSLVLYAAQKLGERKA